MVRSMGPISEVDMVIRVAGYGLINWPLGRESVKCHRRCLGLCGAFRVTLLCPPQLAGGPCSRED